MENLAEKYAELCAKRPELAVTKTNRFGDTLHLGRYKDDVALVWMPEGEVHFQFCESPDALIFRRLAEGLPDYIAIVPSTAFGERVWCVYNVLREVFIQPGNYPDPLSALLAFHLAQPPTEK